ncbi:uncharacterized protein LOC129588952 [Paramacrobiotus metropolitanus]|uniref:uncharacterized protein LOC129588952 n=1 Tax=Paramacrobiotus metropolitanus TaxID=2943436 RepID=UPI00244615EF|nr:uncharacterized protein LOC129588952 [Paramacrobiotus metropolitanus]
MTASHTTSNARKFNFLENIHGGLAAVPRQSFKTNLQACENINQTVIKGITPRSHAFHSPAPTENYPRKVKNLDVKEWIAFLPENQQMKDNPFTVFPSDHPPNDGKRNSITIGSFRPHAAPAG